MKLSFVAVLTVCLFSSVYGLSGTSGGTNSTKRGIIRRMLVLSERADFREDGRGSWLFPEEIDISVDIEGLGVRRLQAKKCKKAGMLTRVIKWLGSASQVLKNRRKQIVEYYVNSKGSFACKPSYLNGRPHCNLMGILHEKAESCFFKDNVAHCKDKKEGTLESCHSPEESSDPVPVPTTTKLYPGNRTITASERKKRQITEPDSNTRVVQVAFYLDAAIMNRFYNLNPSDDGAAEDDAETYIKMVANEMTYRYQTVKDRRLSYRGGILDLAVNPSVIIYPAKGTDFTFISKTSDFLFSSPTLNNFRMFINANAPGAPWDHGMLISGLDLFSSSPSLLVSASLSDLSEAKEYLKSSSETSSSGVAYIRTVCATDNNRFFRVSLNEDQDFNVVETAAHELGHALGAEHDFEGNLCPSRRYIMSAIITNPTAASEDTLYTFSRCSARYFRNHLSDFPDCLLTTADNGFRDNFCSGPRGLRGSSFDYQCQIFWENGPEYSECFGVEKVAPNGCWQPNSILCYPGTGQDCFGLPFVVDGSPCEGPDSQQNYYCYLGDCVEEDDICPPSPPPPPSCVCDSFGTAIGRFLCCLFNSCC